MYTLENKPMVFINAYRLIQFFGCTPVSMLNDAVPTTDSVEMPK